MIHEYMLKLSIGNEYGQTNRHMEIKQYNLLLCQYDMARLKKNKQHTFAESGRAPHQLIIYSDLLDLME